MYYFSKYIFILGGVVLSLDWKYSTFYLELKDQVCFQKVESDWTTYALKLGGLNKKLCL